MYFGFVVADACFCWSSLLSLHNPHNLVLKQKNGKTVKYILSIIAVTFLSACATTSKNIGKNEFYLGGYDGIWVGDMEQIKGSGYPFVAEGKHRFSIMLIIRDETVKVYTQPKESPLKEIKAASGFKILKHKTNAIIYSQDSESDAYNEKDTGDWVETWNMTLTKKDDSSLYIYHVRAVNNFKNPPDHHINESMGRFFFSFSGELKKIAIAEKID